MRTIKFRGKRLDNKKWIYGDLIHIDKSDIGIVTDYAHWQGCRVNPDTVGQFTGLHDKNGKEICEGDILEITDPNTKEKNISVVTWSPKGYYASAIGNNGYIIIGYVDKALIYIIGNIHDNPDLLNDK